jgi:hypothetical protein
MSYYASRNTNAPIKQSKTQSTQQLSYEIQKSSAFQKSTQIQIEKPNLLDVERTNYLLYQDIPGSKIATKSLTNVTSFAVNSHNGCKRNYNEDRASIIVNVKNPNPEIQRKWPIVSYFAIFDGHSGNKCADFLKENLHNYVNSY